MRDKIYAAIAGHAGRLWPVEINAITDAVLAVLPPGLSRQDRVRDAIIELPTDITEEEADLLAESFADLIESEVTWRDNAIAALEQEVAILAKAARRWDFMMAFANSENCPEARAMNALGSEQVESGKPYSVQLTEMIDKAMEKLNGN